MANKIKELVKEGKIFLIFLNPKGAFVVHVPEFYLRSIGGEHFVESWPSQLAPITATIIDNAAAVVDRAEEFQICSTICV